LLLVFASAVILVSKSRETHKHILLSQIWDSPTWRAMSPYLYPPGTGSSSYTPSTGFPLVVSYDSQGYGGLIRPCFHTGPLSACVSVFSSPYRCYATAL
jgi:hypothetical protein